MVKWSVLKRVKKAWELLCTIILDRDIAVLVKVVMANCRKLKVRPHGQKFSRTTWYNMVVRHKTCRGSVDGMDDVCRVTFYVVRPRS